MIKNITKFLTTVLFSIVLTLNAQAVEKWDMPMAYSATNFHSEIGVMFC